MRGQFWTTYITVAPLAYAALGFTWKFVRTERMRRETPLWAGGAGEVPGAKKVRRRRRQAAPRPRLIIPDPPLPAPTPARPAAAGAKLVARRPTFAQRLGLRRKPAERDLDDVRDGFVRYNTGVRASDGSLIEIQWDDDRRYRPAYRAAAGCKGASAPVTLADVIPPAADNVRVRAATEADVPLLLAFIKGLAEYEKLAHTVTATEEQLREHLFGPRPAAEVRVGLLNGDPVGFALFFQNFSTFLAKPGLYLEDLFVLPESRKHGVGKALLLDLAQLAVSRGCGRLEWSVLDWNEPAIGFYRKIGADVLPDWRICRVTGAALEKMGEGRKER